MVQSGVPVVLDGVIRSSIQTVHELCPLVGLLSLQDEEDPLLSVAPALSLEGWVELVVPSLSALFSSSVIEELSDGVPLLRSMDLHKFNQLLVLLCVPGSLLGLVLQGQELLNCGITWLNLVDETVLSLLKLWSLIWLHEATEGDFLFLREIKTTVTVIENFFGSLTESFIVLQDHGILLSDCLLAHVSVGGLLDWFWEWSSHCVALESILGDSFVFCNILADAGLILV